MLHAVNSCGNDTGRERWWMAFSSQLGAPSVTHGIVYVGEQSGALHVIADTSVRTSGQTHCEVEFTSGNPILPDTCFWGFTPVPVELKLPPIQLIGAIRTTPALARNRVYVSTDAGYLFALAPKH